MKTKNLRGIVLRVNSGGGSALASEVIYQELTPEEIREQYGLQIDEDLEKYVKHINFQSKGRRIKIIYKKEGEENG